MMGIYRNCFKFYKGFFFTFLLFFFVGCDNIFAPRLGIIDRNTGLVITEQKPPSEVLQNFRYAYIYRDSLIYSALIDSSFLFIFYNAGEEGNSQYDSWTRSTELKTTSRLFKAFPHINLVWNSTVDSMFYLYEGDNPIRESREYFDDANVADISRTFELNLQNLEIIGTAIFTFKKDKKSNQWRITRWKDKSIF
jgi:hypothetical protein